MLAIADGSIEKVKAEMKQITKWKADEIKKVKNQIKSWKAQEKKAAKAEKRKENPYPKEYDERIEKLEILKERYSSSAVPVRVENIVINYTVYLKSFSKLKGLMYSENIVNNELTIKYQDGRSKGVIHLYDISKLFADLNHIPVAEITNGEEAKTSA